MTALADPRLAEWAHVLYSQAVLTLGARIEEPATFVTKMNDLLVTLTNQTDGVPLEQTDSVTTTEQADDVSLAEEAHDETAAEPQDA